MKKQLQITKKTIDPFLLGVKHLKISDRQSLTEATSFLSQANKYLDSVIEYKEKKTKPLNELLRVIRAETKPLETALENVINELRAKMASYQTKTLAEQKQEEERIAGLIASDEITLEKGVQKMESVAVQKDIKTDDGSVKFKTITKIEVMDIVILANSPNGYQYITPDMVAIRKAFGEGIKLPGVEYKEELSVYNKR